MSNLRQAALQALEALEEQVRRIGPEFDDPFAYGLETDRWALMRKAIPALRAALAEPQTTHWEGCEEVHPECRKPEQEPVGHADLGINNIYIFSESEPRVVPVGRTPLYTAPTPRQWVSLTEQEMYDLFFHDQYGPRLPEYLVNTIKCIEAALKEKNSGS